MVPWKSGKLLVWDATCPDTYAPSYTVSATVEAGAVAARAEERKRTKYSYLDSCHSFTPIAIETSGAFGPQTKLFLRELSQRLRQATGDTEAHSHLLQRLSVAIQRGNSASIVGTIGHTDGTEDCF